MSFSKMNALVALSVCSFALNVFAMDRVSVEREIQMATVDKTIEVVKNGQHQTWSLAFDKAKVELSMDSEGHTEYGFNRWSMCMGRDLGELAAPYTFMAADESGHSRKIVVPASTEAKHIKVSAICPKPGVISELFLVNTDGNSIFPKDVTLSMTARLQKRQAAILSNRQAVALAEKAGVGGEYSYIQSKTICMNVGNAQECGYHMALTLRLEQRDSDGFIEPEISVGALSKSDVELYKKNLNTTHPLLVATNLPLEASKTPSVSTLLFDQNGAMQVQYGSERFAYGDNVKNVAPSKDCAVNLTILNKKQLELRIANTPSCQAQFPYQDMIGSSLILNLDGINR
jgi:hypothetical protein